MKAIISLLPGIATLAGLGLALAHDPIQAQDTPPAPKEAAPAAPAEAPAPVAPPAPPAFNETDVLIEVDGTPITVLDVREFFTARYGRQFEQMPPEQRALLEPQIQQMVVGELIKKTLLINAAEKEGMKVSDEEVEGSLKEIAAQIPEGENLEEFAKNAGVSLDRVRQQIVIDTKIRKLYEKVTADVTKPEEAEVQKYFDDHPEEFKQSASVDAAHILISTQGITDPAQLAAKEKIAKELREEIVSKKGENFAEMAGLHSDCPSKAQGGDLGEFEKGQMVPEFETAAFGQEVGTVGECVKSKFGYHIIKVNGKKEAKTLGFAEVREKLAEVLFEQRKSEKLDSFVESLREKAKIGQPGKPEEPGVATPGSKENAAL